MCQRRLTTPPLVSGYDAVGHNVEDGKQEEANLKMEKDKMNHNSWCSEAFLQKTFHSSGSDKQLRYSNQLKCI